MFSRIQKDIAKLPHSNNMNHLTEYQKFVFEGFSKLRLANSSSLIKAKSRENMLRQDLDTLLEELSDLLFKTSQSISNTYFDHTYKQNQLVTQSFPI